MARLIGIVSKVVGQVFAEAGNGTRRVLTEGDRLYAGEQLVTGAAGAVAVHLQNGQDLTLGRGSSLHMNDSLLASQPAHVDSSADTAPSQAQLTDVEQLQKAIAAGVDPTQTAEATAAGPNVSGAPGDAGGGHSFVLLQETAGRVDPVIGFPTAGFNGIPEFVFGWRDGTPDSDGGDNAGAPGTPGTPSVNPLSPETPNPPGPPFPPIVPENHPVTLTGLSVAGGELTLNEANLANGSASNAAALTQNGTFRVSAPDGLLNLSIGGMNIVSGGTATGLPQSITTGLGNTLIITGYDPATGIVSYSYTLVGNESHAAGDGLNNLSEHFSVIASDTNGDSASNTLDINITDDVPQAYDDSHGVASETRLTLTGNVLDNDTQGADRVPSGPITPGTFTGTYGTLVLAADGSYTYTLHSGDPAFLGLKGGGNGSETFTYTLTDADGDSSSAKLVLNIHNNDDPVSLNGLAIEGGELTVYEKHLGTGSDPTSSALTVNGTFTVTALDGLHSLSVGTLNVMTGGITAGFPQTLPTALGNTLTITGYDSASGVVSYSYTLNGNDAHPNANGANSLSEHFTVTATDVDGSTNSVSLDVNVVDDLPSAADDSNPGVASENQLTLVGNVLDNDQLGADRVTDGPVTPGTLTGTYGHLVLAADGTYTYTVDTSNPAFLTLKADAHEVFTYTITDSDGDSSSATLTLTVHNNDDPVLIDGLNVCGGELTVYERALSDGSTPGTPALTQSGTFTVTALDGVQNLSVGGLNVVTAGVTAGFPQTLTTFLGNTLTITGYDSATGVVSYSYTLNDNENHPTANGANSLSEHFAVTVTDSNGSTASDSLDVNIIDDLPTANADCATVFEGATVNIAVLGNDSNGADGAAEGGAVVGVRAGGNTSTSVIGGLGDPIQGAYGYLTLDAAGNAIYHSTANGVCPPGATDIFTYTIRDGDGDESTTTITINVTDSGLHACVDSCLTVFEKGLDLSKDGQDLAAGTVIGSDPTSTSETAHGNLAGSVGGGSGPLTFTLLGSATGAYGQILLNPDGTYTYTLTSAPKTAPGGNDGANLITETFNYKVTDALGNSTTSSIVVNIVDDVPQAQHSERFAPAGEIDTNLLLVIDVSGSMADCSGVGSLSRLELAQQAISALLDKYDALGDVKVQLVTFNGDASGQSAFWVDVATAKAILASLTAGGGTHYDDALAAAKLAFGTEGKLVGAQNVGYFFSDGKPNVGGQIDPADEAAWKAFLDANGIKNYAIGLGGGVDASHLNPLAYDGSNHVDTDAHLVTDLNQLNSVLTGTVVGVPITGLLMGDGGGFGADGGFIKTVIVEGTTYSFDPHGDNNHGTLSVIEGFNRGVFNTLDNSLTISTLKGGVLVINLDTGEFTYTSLKATAVELTEQIAFTASDYDGDLASRTLNIKVVPNTVPLAADDHVITNILSSHISVPGAALLANDSDANGDPLTATPTTFNTGWIVKGADFTGSGAIDFSAPQNISANRNLADVRGAFAADAAAMTALLVISGFLGQVSHSGANDEDMITVNLKKGETLNLDHNLAAGHIGMEYSLNGGGFLDIGNDSTLTANEDGTYRIHISNLHNPDGSQPNAAESYQLSMTINYAGAHESSPDFVGSYSANDNHGGSDAAAVSISYQQGQILTGTAGDDVLLAGNGDNVLNGGDGNDVLTAGNGNNELHGGAGNDLLFSGLGNDLLDGGDGIDTASYAHATAGVTVNLGLQGGQNTVGAGVDTLVSIENLTGSNWNDTLIGNDQDNLIIGGLGNNTLTGGGGSDTFKWLAGNSGHDVVTDFTPGTDKLDLSQLLQGEHASSTSLDDYLHFSVSGSGASLVTSIDIKATVGAPSTQTIDLAGVNLADHYGVTPGAGGVIAGGHDTATIINGMLNDHSLKVDTV
ncbi:MULTISPECIES: retention module-containing protein [Pseudomonas]|uniref:retention module-containing protein n=1 Tax=Pseudomonas TaxID=286 RepID=UPI000CFFE941|nr:MULTISPECIES: retention module-containing protein [Pseudomonas]PRA55736.1 RTX toxin [Pseudomonas sp. MYb115]QXN51710.1 retention module-containing protein [Pseudomonas fluorescens]WSO26035.1 retention module-containing protein [Pseudomonas fluorescens]